MAIQVASSKAVANATVLENLLKTTNASALSEKSLDDESIFTPHSGSLKNLFFVFPILGLLVLCSGSWFLRHRRIQQAQQSARIEAARLRARDENNRAKEALRLKMVQNALVTTRVVTRISNERRSRSYSIESGATSLDVSNSTYYSQSAAESVFNSSGNNDSKQEINAREEDDRPVYISGTDSHAATQILSSSLSNSLTLEHPIEMQKWDLESCAICLEPYEENESVSYSKHQNCTHAFHTKCILNWLKDECRNDCPYCRSPYVHVCIVESEYDIFGDKPPSRLGIIFDEEQADASINSSTEPQSSQTARE